MTVQLIHSTQNSESLIAWMARVSSDNRENRPIDELIKYCIKNGHWSIFEMASMCVEIVTSRAISAQIIRHKSFSFQEFSQRYAKTTSLENVEPRLQDFKNRQNSIEMNDPDDELWFKDQLNAITSAACEFYQQAIDRGIAKEVARMALPMCSTTKIYMHGTVRSWIHYLQTRCSNGTQKEHKEIAEEVKRIFVKEFPVISLALGWADLNGTKF